MEKILFINIAVLKTTIIEKGDCEIANNEMNSKRIRYCPYTYRMGEPLSL